MQVAASAPGMMQVYGSKISYYTGKFEAYLRYRSIPYESPNYLAGRKKMIAGTGIAQMPVVQLTDGRWMTDTTPMIAWMEKEQNAPSIYPVDSGIAFIALLIEDYADEWLWRSAMHYRWTYRSSRQYAAEFLYNELMRGVIPVPRFVGLNMLKRRQYRGFVRGDGVNQRTRAHNDRTYLRALACLQAIFERRPFLLGQTPTIADFGMMAPMFRHFSEDPDPAEIMRERAPAVYEWVARMWNVKPAPGGPDLIAEIDTPLEDLLTEVCETHLAQLGANAGAYTNGQKRFDAMIQGCNYTRLPVSRYRVWCLEVLQRAWGELMPDVQIKLQAHLAPPAAQILWEEVAFSPSDYDAEGKTPFNRAINVYGTGLPS